MDNSAKIVEHKFENSESLAVALSAAVAENLRDGIAARGCALLAVSGGTTPEMFMTELSSQRLAWSRVTVTLADERWVSPTNPRSNELLVRDKLLRNEAAAAKFVALYTGAPDPESGCAAANASIAALPLPFDAMILGLGTDGHCASLFPDGDRFEQALDPAGANLVLPMRAASAGEPRITLTLPAIVTTRHLYLHIEGADKRDVFDRIERSEGVFARSPLRSITTHASVPLNVYWCG